MQDGIDVTSRKPRDLHMVLNAHLDDEFLSVRFDVNVSSIIALPTQYLLASTLIWLEYRRLVRIGFGVFWRFSVTI
jgi:hypothetical protein